MGWYLLCTALLLSISLLRPHLPLFPLRACLCCTLPLPSTAPPSWSHLETEQVLWRDRGWLRKVSHPCLMTPAPFSVHYAETVSVQEPRRSHEHHRTRGRLVTAYCVTGGNLYAFIQGAHPHIHPWFSLKNAWIVKFVHWNCMYDIKHIIQLWVPTKHLDRSADIVHNSTGIFNFMYDSTSQVF